MNKYFQHIEQSNVQGWCYEIFQGDLSSRAKKDVVKAGPSGYFAEGSQGGVGVGWILKSDDGFKVFIYCLALWSWDFTFLRLLGKMEILLTIAQFVMQWVITYARTFDYKLSHI